MSDKMTWRKNKDGTLTRMKNGEPMSSDNQQNHSQQVKTVRPIMSEDTSDTLRGRGQEE